MAVDVSGQGRDHSPAFNNGQPSDWIFALFRRQWVRYLLAGALLLLAAGFVYTKAIVGPASTATRYTAWLAGDSRRFEVIVDSESGVSTFSNAQRGLSEVVVTGSSLFVLAKEVGISNDEVIWVELPLKAVDNRFGALSPATAASALGIGTKECRPPSADAVVLFGLFLDSTDALPAGDSMCGSAWSIVAEAGQTVLVDQEAVRPGDPGQPSQSSVTQLNQTSDPASIIEIVNRQLPDQ